MREGFVNGQQEKRDKRYRNRAASSLIIHTSIDYYGILNNEVN